MREHFVRAIANEDLFGLDPVMDVHQNRADDQCQLVGNLPDGRAGWSRAWAREPFRTPGAPISHWAIEWPGLATSWHKQLARRPNEASGGSSSSWIPSWASVTITTCGFAAAAAVAGGLHRQPTLCGETRIPSLIAASSYPASLGRTTGVRPTCRWRKADFELESDRCFTVGPANRESTALRRCRRSP